jgi:hypothetical protein
MVTVRSPENTSIDEGKEMIRWALLLLHVPLSGSHTKGACNALATLCYHVRNVYIQNSSVEDMFGYSLLQPNFIKANWRTYLGILHIYL